MKKLAIITSLIILAACSKEPTNDAYKEFIEICHDTAEAEKVGLDCECQGRIVNKDLDENELALFNQFIKFSKNPGSMDKLKELASKPEFKSLQAKIRPVLVKAKDECPNKK